MMWSEDELQGPLGDDASALISFAALLPSRALMPLAAATAAPLLACHARATLLGERWDRGGSWAARARRSGT